MSYVLFAFSPGLNGYINWDGLTNDVLDFHLGKLDVATVIESKDVADSYARSLTTLTEYIVDVEVKKQQGV
jgi:hypothetical protein